MTTIQQACPKCGKIIIVGGISRYEAQMEIDKHIASCVGKPTIERYDAKINHHIPFHPGSTVSIVRRNATEFLLIVDNRVYGCLSKDER